MLRFLSRVGVLTDPDTDEGVEPVVMDEAELVNVTADRAGSFYRLLGARSEVRRGDVLARILDPYCCEVLAEVKSPVDGTVFFAHNQPLALQHAIIYRILPKD